MKEDKVYVDYEDYIPELANRFSQLETQEAIDPKQETINCNEGVYVFYEEGRPIYVGRTNRMKKRLQEHLGGFHYSAHFAFNIARKNAMANGIKINRSREELSDDDDFKKEFAAAKDRVAKMKIKYIEIRDDDILQALFEIYAIIKLQTFEYNQFKTN